MRILGFEAWDSGSHRSVRESLVRHGAAQWTWLTLGRGPWRWRQRMGITELVAMGHERGLLQQSWDCFLCTSLLAVGELRGLLPATLRSVPIAMLVHENQVAYPAGAKGLQERDLHGVITDLTAMHAADLVIFTSHWNQRSCLEGFQRVLHKSPVRHWQAMLERIHERSCVIWPPVEDPREIAGIEHNCDVNGRHGGSPVRLGDATQIVWPHRHQPDKGPSGLRALAARYSRSWGLQWRLLGERCGPTPQAITRLRAEQAQFIAHDAYCQSRQDYVRQLAAANWVCSTAKHEFFGIAVVEALLMGCLPWLPNRLSYPELLPNEAHGLHPGMAIDPPTRQALQRAIAAHLKPAIATEATGRLEAALVQLISDGKP